MRIEGLRFQRFHGLHGIIVDVDANVKGRLYRMVATHPWTLFFPKAVVHHVSASRSDHRPLLLTLHGSHKMKQ